MYSLLLSALNRIDQAKIPYCLLRDGDQLQQIALKGEADLLVHKVKLEPLRELLTEIGFVALPNWGHAPHHFFVAYSSDTDSWLKLDVVTEIAYGRPVRAMRTGLGLECLNTRQRCGDIFVPAPECELITLLLHCVLDKGKFAPDHIQRLQTLRGQISDVAYLEMLLAAYWRPGMSWAQLAGYIDAGQWSALLSKQEPIARHLVGDEQIATRERQWRKRILRKLNRWVYAARPRSVSVALLAPDGAGKSTLTSSLSQSFYFPVHTVYMGLYQKGQEKALNIPLPGVGILEKLVTQWWRYGVARYHQARRRLVIFDRYTYDALLPARRPLRGLQKVRRWLLAHACPAPDLVIVLDAPGNMLYARKGEHSAAVLEQQRQHYLALRSQVPNLVVVDATQDTDHVRRAVTALIWHCYLRRQTGMRRARVAGALAGDVTGAIS